MRVRHSAAGRTDHKTNQGKRTPHRDQKQRSSIWKSGSRDFIIGLAIAVVMLAFALLSSGTAFSAPIGGLRVESVNSVLAGQRDDENSRGLTLHKIHLKLGEVPAGKQPGKTFQVVPDTFLDPFEWPLEILEQRIAVQSISSGFQFAVLRAQSHTIWSGRAKRLVGLGVLAVVFALMCTLTFGFWRYLHAAYAAPPRKHFN